MDLRKRKRRLSNTATPYYYGIFRDQVRSGIIPVCETISMEMNRIDDLIANPNYFYDPDAVEGFIEFCEHEMTTTEGGPIVMLDSFKLWAEELFGWYYFVIKTVYVPGENGEPGHYENKRQIKRLIKKQFIIVPRGAAKTMYNSFIQGFSLICDTSTTSQITTAPTFRQSNEVLTTIKTAMSRHPGPLLTFMTEGSIQNTNGNKYDRVKLAATKEGIRNFMSNSMLQIYPMSIDKLQGLRCKVATVDEWLSGDTREDPIGAIEQGASKLDDYIIVATSSEGTVRNGVGDSIKMELLSILKGEYKADHVSIWYYKLDDIMEVGYPEMWIKANPNLGKTVSYEVYQEDVSRAEKAPSARNDILAKRFNIPMEGCTYFFTYEETLPIKGKVNSYWGCSCALGADLSQGDDFCAFTFLFPLSNGKFGVKTRSYISDLTFNRLSVATRHKYEEFINEGTLTVLNGSTLDMRDVYDDLDRFIVESNYAVCAFGFDPYNAKDFVERYEKDYGPRGIVKVIQGAKTESVPLGELKKLASERDLLFDESLMQFAMGNCIVLEDTNGNRKLWKKEEKIK